MCCVLVVCLWACHAGGALPTPAPSPVNVHATMLRSLRSCVKSMLANDALGSPTAGQPSGPSGAAFAVLAAECVANLVQACKPLRRVIRESLHGHPINASYGGKVRPQLHSPLLGRVALCFPALFPPHSPA